MLGRGAAGAARLWFRDADAHTRYANDPAYRTNSHLDRRAAHLDSDTYGDTHPNTNGDDNANSPDTADSAGLR